MKKYKEFTIGRMVNESYQIGDLIQINFDMDEDPDDGEYAFSIEKGEIGEITNCINKYETIEHEKVFRIKFPPKNGKKRIYQTLVNEPAYTKIQR